KGDRSRCLSRIPNVEHRVLTYGKVSRFLTTSVWPEKTRFPRCPKLDSHHVSGSGMADPPRTFHYMGAGLDAGPHLPHAPLGDFCSSGFAHANMARRRQPSGELSLPRCSAL